MLQQKRTGKTLLWLITIHEINCEVNVSGCPQKANKSEANNKKEENNNSINNICSTNQKVGETYPPISEVNTTMMETVLIYIMKKIIATFRSTMD